jgi:ring-1,2-phenylacetyl-CoA epoxidase subunit PaaD
MGHAYLTRDEVLAWLEEVKDPEIPVLSVVELGVVRDVRVSDAGVEVDITPTYSGCPAMRVMEDEIRSTLRAHGVHEPRIATVFREAWTTDWMTPTAREKLRAFGIAPPAPGAPGDATGGALVTLTRRGGVPCPYCGSRETVLQSEFGSTACKAIHACRTCRQPFDHFKPI